MELKANECGEYEVAKGVSASLFGAILVSNKLQDHLVCLHPKSVTLRLWRL